MLSKRFVVALLTVAVGTVSVVLVLQPVEAASVQVQLPVAYMDSCLVSPHLLAFRVQDSTFSNFRLPSLQSLYHRLLPSTLGLLVYCSSPRTLVVRAWCLRPRFDVPTETWLA
jgi:hypothetical protein